MDDRDLEILQELYAQKNITRAAAALYMSQPTLTARLQHIEREFDVTVVTRNAKGIQFTTEGEFLVQKTRQLLSEYNNIKNEIHQLNGAIAGTIEIAASNYFTLYSLPQLLDDFRKNYPQVKYLVHSDWSRNISLDISKQKLPIGFVSADYGYTKNKVLLFSEPICAAFNAPFNLQELPNMQRITYQSDNLIKLQIDKWWYENFSRPYHSSITVTRLQNCLHMMLHGLGYAILPYRLVANYPHIHTIILQDKQGQPLTRSSWLLYSDDALTLPTTRCFVDFVTDYPFNNISCDPSLI